MRNLKFKYLAAENFFCFGSPGIELNLESYGNIVLIRGNNLDVDDEEEKIAGNGVGKSTIPEVLVYTLTGKTIKHPKKIKHSHCINNITGKNLRGEVQWDNFRVVRTRKPDSLRLWESADGVWDDAHELTLGGMPATQALIEDKLGLNYESLVNVLVFTDDKSKAFLELDTPAKREIVENLLSLDVYREYCQTAKDKRNEAKAKLKDIAGEYDNKLAVLQDAKDRLVEYKEEEDKWYSERRVELKNLLANLRKKQTELESTDTGTALSRYEDAQVRIREINEMVLPELEDKQTKFDGMIKLAQEKLTEARSNKQDVELNLQKVDSAVDQATLVMADCDKAIKQTKKKTGTKCPECFGKVDEKNFADFVRQMKERMAAESRAAEEEQAKREPLRDKDNQLIVLINSLEEAIKGAKEKRKTNNTALTNVHGEASTLADIEKPETAVNEAVLQKQIQTLREQTLAKEKETKNPSPHANIIENAEKEVVGKQKEADSKKKELEKADAELPYYEFWVKAFGDKGIRKFVIDGIVPALNARVAHWLLFLIDGKIKVEFDNELEETIDRIPFDANPFVYAAMSGGQKQRMNLAVSQAFAHVMMLNIGTCPSLAFLDEVTTNIDPIGVVGVYNMIIELAKERQVFVTTHDQDLLDMLEGCDEINLEMKDGFTKLI